MRSFARIGCALAAMALAAPTLAEAGIGTPAPGPYNTGRSPASKSRKKAEKLCGECQRIKMRKEQGIELPPPPALPPGVPVKGSECTRCGRPTVIDAGPAVPSVALPGRTPSGMVGGAMVYEAPGRAVVGEMPAGNGVDPAPIGIAGPRVAGMTPPRMSRPGGLRDSAVMPTSMQASAPAGLPGENRPHILTHLFGLDALGHNRIERQRRKTELHAAISYDQATYEVNDLPTSAVFGRRAPK